MKAYHFLVFVLFVCITKDIFASDFTVSLVGTSTTQYVSKNNNNVLIASVSIKSNGSNVDYIKGLSVDLSGLGNYEDLYIAVSKDLSMISNFYRFSSARRTQICLNEPLAIGPGEVQKISFILDLGGKNDNSQHNFSLKDINGSFYQGLPLVLGMVNTTSYQVLSQIGFSHIESISTQLLSGAINETMGRFSVLNGDYGSELNAFSLGIEGQNVKQKLQNIRLWENGVVTSAGIDIVDNKLFISNIKSIYGPRERKEYEIRTDVNSGEDGTDIKLINSNFLETIARSLEDGYNANIVFIENMKPSVSPYVLRTGIVDSCSTVFTPDTVIRERNRSLSSSNGSPTNGAFGSGTITTSSSNITPLQISSGTVMSGSVNINITSPITKSDNPKIIQDTFIIDKKNFLKSRVITTKSIFKRGLLISVYRMNGIGKSIKVGTTRVLINGNIRYFAKVPGIYKLVQK